MRTAVATGSSTTFSLNTAVKEATTEARKGLGAAKPSFGFLFAAPSADLGAALATARDVSGVEMVGCTTAGEVTERGLTHDGIAVMLVSSDATIEARFATGLKSDPSKVAGQLLGGIAELKGAAAARDQRHLTTVLLTDGLAVTGEKLVQAMHDQRVQSGSQVVGGAAGDEGKFVATSVGAKGKSGSDAAAALHVFGAAQWGVGVDHGLRATTKPMRVTKAEGNVVQEIDGQPAFAVYEKHAAARGTKLTRENAGKYLIANELGVCFFDKISRARAPLSVGADGSLTCAGDIPRGSMVSILDGEVGPMVAAAKTAAEKAHKQLGHRRVAGVLLFDCVCRGMILKDQFDKEVEAVRSVFRGAPIAGFLTYGEIARSSDLLDGWHNTTAVVVAIPE
jgi:methyl-accepting chemotaxis protein